MADRTFDAAETLTAFRESGHWWRSLVGGVDDHQWDLMALGEWTVRELVAHGGRAFKTVAEYAEGDTKDPTRIATAAEYFRIVLAEQTPHVHIANRARQEARGETDWVSATDHLWAAAELVVSKLPGDADLHTFVGEMALDQYLATRVVELVVHGTDLAEAIGIPSPPPASGARVAIDVLLDLSTADDAASVLRLLTGRSGSLPLANVLA
ncbi:maleylpyruvate isomerase N-terminal domain-containing protein [Aquihabitans daechungensis]|uniref:maleylpyruvate isomerase N-terminal domain-containing protein n=1 Tax=Aquihabitans daechungensis TaxID=1052257 RepID=UPI003BA2F7E7